MSVKPGEAHVAIAVFAIVVYFALRRLHCVHLDRSDDRAARSDLENLSLDNRALGHAIYTRDTLHHALAEIRRIARDREARP